MMLVIRKYCLIRLKKKNFTQNKQDKRTEQNRTKQNKTEQKDQLVINVIIFITLQLENL